MPNKTKPILYNGYEVEPGTTVKSRIGRVLFTEVYELSDSRFLYLFLKLNPNEVLKDREKYELIRIASEDSELLGTIVRKHSNDKVAKIIDELTNLRGFDAIAGMNDLKNLLQNEVINPLRHPERFKKFKVSIPNGIILHGPPGCGKTFMVRKLAEELGYEFIEAKHSDLASPYIHGAVGNIGRVFSEAKKQAPAILFFDEISGLVPDRRKFGGDSTHKEEEVNEFLMQLNDAADAGVLVVGATNYIDRIDPAVLRAGRFDRKIYVPPPDEEARIELFKLGLTGRPHAKKINFKALAKKTKNYSSADIVEGIVESVSRTAANRGDEEITQKLIEAEIANYKPLKLDDYKEPEIGFSA